MRTLDEIRGHLTDRLNRALRRPGMFGGELALRYFLEDLTFIDDADEAWSNENDQLVERGCWSEIGIAGAFATIFGDRRFTTHEHAVASVYADMAHRLGYLQLDNTLGTGDYRQLRRQARPWCRASDRSLADVLATDYPLQALRRAPTPR
jgi:hypothetical protein